MQIIDKRLFQLTEKKNLFKLVIARLLYLAATIIMWWVIAEQLGSYLQTGEIMLPALLVTFVATLLVKILLTRWME